MILAGANNDIPFDKKESAATVAKKKGIENFAIVAVEGGFGIDETAEAPDPTPTLITTSPWNSTDNAWAPDIFKLGKKREGFRVRFCDPNPENIEQKKSEGWTIADCKNYGMTPDGSHGSNVTARGMILMEITEAIAVKREKYHSDLTKKRTLGNDELKKAAERVEVETGEDAGISDMNK